MNCLIMIRSAAKIAKKAEKKSMDFGFLSPQGSIQIIEIYNDVS